MLDPNLHPQPFQQLQLNPVSESLKADLSWLTGNITPISWYQHIRTPATPTKPKGSPDAIAVALLSDIMYWYRPTEIRDEGTGQVLGYTQKFAADQLQKSYQSYATMFGVSKNKVKESFDLLEDLKLINREFRVVTLPVSGLVLSNVMFIEPILNNVKKISTPPKPSKSKTPTLQQSKGVSPIKGGGGYQIKGGVAPIQKGGDKYGEYAEISHTTTTETPTSVSSPINLPETTSRSSLSYSINNFKEQNNIIPVESSQAITNTSNTRIINKVENDCNFNNIQTELIALVPEKHKQPIVIKFINQTLKSGVNADTIKSSILYTNTHSKGNIKQYRSYLGKTIENPNWHIGYLEQTELEHQLQQEVKNVAALKTNNNQEEPQKIDKGREETEAFDNFMKTADVEAFDRFIETQCWDSLNNMMRRLWKEGNRYFTRRLNMQKFIDSQNGTEIVANPILPVAAQPSFEKVIKPIVTTPIEEVKTSKNGLTSLSFILSNIVTDLKPRATL